MKKVLLLPVFFLALGAASASAQVEGVLVAESTIEPTTEVIENPTALAPEDVVVNGTTTLELVSDTTATSSTTTSELATTSVPTLPVITKENPLVTDTISIIPGSISLKLTTSEPAVASRVNASQNGAVKTETTDGLFDLIYTGFEEFVFKVFGI